MRLNTPNKGNAAMDIRLTLASPKKLLDLEKVYYVELNLI